VDVEFFHAKRGQRLSKDLTF